MDQDILQTLVLPESNSLVIVLCSHETFRKNKALYSQPCSRNKEKILEIVGRVVVN